MVAAVVSDGDQRTSRVAECAGMVTEVLAGLDPIDDCLGSGECLGWLGSAGALFALAIAASAARVERRPILLVTVSHAFDRAALIVRPDIPEPFATT